MPLLIDRSCPEWQKRNRQHRKIAYVATLAFFALLIGGAMAIDHFSSPVESAAAEPVNSD